MQLHGVLHALSEEMYELIVYQNDFTVMVILIKTNSSNVLCKVGSKLAFIEWISAVMALDRFMRGL